MCMKKMLTKIKYVKIIVIRKSKFNNENTINDHSSHSFIHLLIYKQFLQTILPN